ncbi:hypothetical protein E6C76_18960 [Pseudothauera nasutitermitis]|uniref:Uncharacterized protein n=1 Tax=Pseudothauera nasutitermitis TaxID=2565930 RepID=A0A4S4ARJ4_9RHOO|nr:hypothetical protein [Pseudothauera nasutitermitis]THF62395.1 hypothetical protein E6C76_18960 [Pseudothauera nasutitermitis]
MKISSSYTQTTAAGGTPPSASKAGSFQSVLDTAYAGTATSTDDAQADTPPLNRAERIQADNEATRAEFFEYMRKSPMERMRDAVLRSMGLTEEDLEAMPPEKREQVELEIAQRIRERLLRNTEQSDERGTPAGPPDQSIGAVDAGRPLSPWSSAAGMVSGAADQAKT